MGLLDVQHLSVSFLTPKGETQVLRDVSFSLARGETLAIIGASGCGKSVLCKSILKLLPPSAVISSGKVCVNGTNILDHTEQEMCRLRGKVCSIVLQNPMTALHPSLTIGAQIGEAVKAHQRGMTKKQIQERVLALMQMTGIDHPKERMRQYPRQFSGGMLQRVVIASALACDPDVLLADEPTTALDAVTQELILKLLIRLKKEEAGLATVFVTHDPKAAARVADRVAVLYEGKIVETGTAREVFKNPAHPYTRTLLQALPSVSAKAEADYGMNEAENQSDHAAESKKEILLDVRHLSCQFPLTGQTLVRAVDDLSFQICQGEILGLVGASGCGKSTVARCIMNICRPAAGQIVYNDIDICKPLLYRKNKRMLQRSRQIIFQDSGSSLNPRMKVCDIITEPLGIQRILPKRGSMQAEAEYQMCSVGLDKDLCYRYPSELSGGQRQRVAIARALTMEPQLLVADEPLTSLDAISQMQIVQLFLELKQRYGFTLLFIAHDLAMVEWLCDRVGVMYRGKLVECAPVRELFENPKHSYTKALFAAEPENAACHRVWNG